MPNELLIDPEFRDLIPPLKPHELDGLESSLLSHGCLDALKVWGDTLLDGHNRHDLCTKHGLPFRTEPIDLPDREAAKLWIEENQLGRRNLDDDQRAGIAARIARRRGEINRRERAKKGRLVGGDATPEQQAEREANRLLDTSSNKRLDTPKAERKQAAVDAKVPERKVKDAIVLDKVAPKLLDKVIAGTVTMKAAKREVKEKQRAQERKKAAAAVVTLPDTIRHGDFRTVLADVPDNSVALIFTDPPYDRNSLGLYGDLADLAARVLVPGGSLVAYAGTYALPEIFPLLTRDGLRYCWTIVVKHESSPARTFVMGTFVHYKPLVWFTKGPRRDKEMIADFLQSKKPDKTAHDWEQSSVEAEYLIKHLTSPGELVLDPLCGSGTTLRAAKLLGRRFLGAEIDEERAKVASSLLALPTAESA